MPNENVRSLNLANSVGIVLYEALRQIKTAEIITNLYIQAENFQLQSSKFHLLITNKLRENSQF